MNITAKLLEKYETVQVSPKFKKREFVVEYAENPQYPEYLKFELVQDNCSRLDHFSVGQELEIHFNLKGRKWTDPQGTVKYFNSLQAWRLVVAGDKKSENRRSEDGVLSDAPPPWLDEADNDNGIPF